MPRRRNPLKALQERDRAPILAQYQERQKAAVRASRRRYALILAALGLLALGAATIGAKREREQSSPTPAARRQAGDFSRAEFEDLVQRVQALENPPGKRTEWHLPAVLPDEKTMTWVEENAK